MDFPQALEFLLYGVLILFVIGRMLSGFFQVQTAEAAAIQRMGKFNRVANVRHQFQIALVGSDRGAALTCASNNWRSAWKRKTKDNVFVKMPVSEIKSGAEVVLTACLPLFAKATKNGHPSFK